MRKFSPDPYQADDLVTFGTMSAKVARFLATAVNGRLNILVSGGAGAGKTTTLNVLSSWLPAGERIVTIEDAAELQLRQEHVVTLESRPPNIEGKGETSPIASNASESGRAQNRRVEIKLVPITQQDLLDTLAVMRRHA